MEVFEFSHVKAEIIIDDDAYRTNQKIKEELNGKKIRNKFDPAWMTSKADYDNIISELKINPSKKAFNWQAEIIVEKEIFSSDLFLITIWLRNITGGKNFEKFLFNCNLNIDLQENELYPYEYTFIYEEFEYNQQGNLRTINCHGDYFEETNTIITRPFGLFKQQRKAPRTSINDIFPKFNELKNSLDIL